jgi:Transposase family tnp2
MLSLLILIPKQPGNDIDVYVQPLLEDLGKLWKDNLKVFDVYL